MSNLMGLDLKVDENAIGQVVKTVIESSIVEALGAKDQLVEQAVKTMLSTKVDEKGQKPRYSSDEKYNLIERSEEHTSELQSRGHLVCRLLLEKKKNTTT